MLLKRRMREMAVYLSSNDFNQITNNPKYKVRGRVNRSNGLSLESKIESSCAFYLSQNIASIEKTPEPMKIVGKEKENGGIFRAVFMKKAQPDFKGVLHGGRCVLFEAKHTTQNYMPKKAVLDVQAEKLTQYDSLGALCFVLISFGFKNYYRIPWIVWSNMEETFGRAYLKEEDIQKYKVPSEGNFIDFLFGYKSNF